MRRRKVLVALALSLSTVCLTSLSSRGTTASAAANALSISPANPAIGAPVVLSISNLPAGSVDFSVGGVPMGSAYVTGPTGEASITTALWSNGTFPVLATLNRYWGGVLTTTNFNGTVTVGTTTTSLPPSSTTTSTTTPPSTGGALRYLGNTPVVTGIGRVGETLECSFVPGPPEFKMFEWFDGNGQLIPTATTTQYVVRQGDLGQAINCSLTTPSAGKVLGIPLLINNESGALPIGVVTTSTTGTVRSTVFSTCTVEAGSNVILGYRFLNSVQLAKGLFTVIVSQGNAQVSSGLRCEVFAENRVGRAVLSAVADTSRKQINPIAITGSGRVGRRLTCAPPSFSPPYPSMTALEWTYDNIPAHFGSPEPTSVGPATYIVQAADVGKELRCRARFVQETLSFSGIPPLPVWVYSAPVLARR
jgi:hypothetical protein